LFVFKLLIKQFSLPGCGRTKTPSGVCVIPKTRKNPAHASKPLQIQNSQFEFHSIELSIYRFVL